MKFSHVIAPAFAATIFFALAPQTASACENRTDLDVRGSRNAVDYRNTGSCNTTTSHVWGKDTRSDLKIHGSGNLFESYGFGNGTSMKETVLNNNSNVIRFNGPCRESREHVSHGNGGLDIRVSGGCSRR